MYSDLLEIFKDFVKKLLASRLFILSIFFTGLFGILVVRLFNLQVVSGEEYQQDYMALTEKTIKLDSTRGNIYDKNGNILAYNELSYNVTIQDNGDYAKSNDKNRMLLELVRILYRHGEAVEGEFSIGFDSSGKMVYTTTSESSRKRFIADFYGLRSTSDLDDEEGKYPSAITPREMFEKRVTYYGLDKLKDENGNLIEITDE
ncbi:MAG: penicillin-binding protein, partial [Lachnospiraceae bacterium]|nr:penicillin-binding protein [Lachnospiraceae bacterium]